MKRNKYSPAKNLDLAEKSLRKSIGYLCYAVDEDVIDSDCEVMDLVRILAQAGQRMQTLALGFAHKAERCKAESI